MSMNQANWEKSRGITRRDFFRRAGGGILLPYLAPFSPSIKTSAILNNLYWVKEIPDLPFTDTAQPNHHLGLDSLLYAMADSSLKFYRSLAAHPLCGTSGLIAADDVVLIKVNAQWKYRGCTNSDLIRGLIQRILDHPDGFRGEVVIFENGQGRGSLNCNTSSSYGGDTSIRANANDENHSFLYLVNNIFKDSRVSAFLLDPIRNTFIGNKDHITNGYRKYENVSYPCFTTAGGHRVELREGIWSGGRHGQNLKLINVPVLKHHDTGGSEITASLKHFYGVVSMADGQSGFRHYSGLGETCGKMMASVASPVLNVIDAIWVSYSSLAGYPASTTFRMNQLLASQDPIALDYWAAKYILYPIDGNFRHHPDFSGVNNWLLQARDTINGRGGLLDSGKGVVVDRVTKKEEEMNVHTVEAGDYLRTARITLSTNSLFFTTSGSTANATQEKSVAVGISGSSSLVWSAEKNTEWISLSPTSGTGSGTLTVRADAAGLNPGRYMGKITIECPEAANSPQFVFVVLKVLESRGRSQRNFGGKF